MLVAHNVSEARIMCFRFSLMRETDTKITRVKSWAIVSNLYTKTVLRLENNVTVYGIEPISHIGH